MKKNISKTLLTVLSLVVTSCSLGELNTKPKTIAKVSSNTTFLTTKELESFKIEYASFTTKALSQQYLDRKIRKLTNIIALYKIFKQLCHAC